MRFISRVVASGYVTEAGGGSFLAIDGVVNSAVIDYDARASASYSGSGTTWSNLITTPADGETHSAALLPSSAGVSEGPVFNGLASTSSAYFTNDISAAGYSLMYEASTGFLGSIQNTSASGNPFWFSFTFNNGDNAYISNQLYSLGNVEIIFVPSNASSGYVAFFNTDDASTSLESNILFSVAGSSQDINVVITGDLNQGILRYAFNYGAVASTGFTSVVSPNIASCGTNTTVTQTPLYFYTGSASTGSFRYQHVGVGNRLLSQTTVESILSIISTR